MSLRMNKRQIDSVTVIDMSGKIILGEETAQLRETVKRMLSEGNDRILLNLSDVTYIDSSGLGQLVSCFATTSEKGGQMKLLNLTNKVKEVLQITKLSTVFDIFEDENKAIQSF